jgi:type I restriction enzyme S subunit
VEVVYAVVVVLGGPLIMVAAMFLTGDIELPERVREWLQERQWQAFEREHLAAERGLWLEPGDILVERSNTPELVGTAALYKGPRGWAIFPDLLIRVRVGDALLPEFLEIYLRARPTRRYFQRAAQGIAGSMPKIDQGAVERLEVPLPPLEEQRRIVAEVEERLSAIDALRAAIERAQRRSAALRRAVPERAFRGELVPQDPFDELAEALLARIRAERGA